jgi:hypothetical protein
VSRARVVMTVLLAGGLWGAFPPADAHQAVAFSGTIIIQNGLEMPGLAPARGSLWDMDSVVALPIIVDGYGSISGHCGSASGTGLANLGHHTANVTVQLLGTSVVFFSEAIEDQVFVLVGQTRAIPAENGDVPCVSSPALFFTVVGVAGAVS